MLLQPEVKITVTDNGFVLEWSRDTSEWNHMPRKKTRGVEVFTSKEKLMQRVRVLLS